MPSEKCENRVLLELILWEKSEIFLKLLGGKSLCSIAVVLGLFVKHLFTLKPEVIAP